MSVYRRGRIWYYKFRFQRQLIRESTHSASKTVAVSAERIRRRQLEESFNRIPKREHMPLLKVAAQEWLATKQNLGPKTVLGYTQRVAVIVKEFGKRLVCDIGPNDFAEYQRKRLADDISPRTVNYETGCLRGILKHYGIWGTMSDRVKQLKQSHEVGKAVSREDETKLLKQIEASRSPILLPLFIVALDTGLRASELRSLQWRDLELTVDSVELGHLIVPKSKTEAGKGRLVPLTTRAATALAKWKQRFPHATADSYVFPYHRVGQESKDGSSLYDVDLNRPIGEWKTSWLEASARAKVRYRWHDLRHTFISRLAESPNVSEQTIRELAGHVSKEMLQRYSHIRKEAKVQAIAHLEKET